MSLFSILASRMRPIVESIRYTFEVANVTRDALELFFGPTVDDLLRDAERAERRSANRRRNRLRRKRRARYRRHRR